MKHVALKTLPMTTPGGDKLDLSYKNQLKGILSQASDPQRGLDVEEIRKSLRVLDALDAATGDFVALEDADYAYMVQRVKAARFVFVCKELVQFVDDVTGA